MNTITLKALDQLIESALTNVKSAFNVNAKTDDFSSQLDNDINKPVQDYLNKSASDIKTNMDFYNKLKSIQRTSPEKHNSELKIKDSKESMQRIEQLRKDLTDRTNKLKAQQTQQQLQMQMAMKNMNNKDVDNNDNISAKQPKNFSSIIKKTINEFYLDETAPKAPSMPVSTSNNLFQQPQATPMPKKVLKVNFDSKTEHPFQAEFTERGFLIGSTRLSFEVIETALAKNFTITLDGGGGMVLDAIKMQKLLKYKNRV